MEKVSNEAQFLAPLVVRGHSVSTEYTDVGDIKLEEAKRRIAEALGASSDVHHNNVWYEVFYNNSTGVHKITGTLLNASTPARVVS